MINNPENQKNVNNDTVQEEITVENIGKYRGVLEKKLEERNTPECIRTVLLSTVDYLNGDIDIFDQGCILSLVYPDIEILYEKEYKGEDAELRKEELKTVKNLGTLSIKGPGTLDNYMPLEKKRQSILEELIPYLR